MNWRNEFRKDIKRKIKISKAEYKLYKETGSIIYLQQACNKLFSAVENYLMVKYNRKVESYQVLRGFVTNEKNKVMLRDAAQLHYFFYNGKLQMDNVDAESLYGSVFKRLKIEMK